MSRFGVTAAEARAAIPALTACVESYHTAIGYYASAKKLLTAAQAEGRVEAIRLAEWDVDTALAAVGQAKADLAAILMLLLRAAAEVVPGALSQAIGELPAVRDVAEQLAELQELVVKGGAK